MIELALIVVGLACIVGTGTAALFLSQRPRVAGSVSAWGVVVGALLGLVSAGKVLFSGQVLSVALHWPLANGAVTLGVDPLSAFFLVPVLGLGAVAAVYGSDYLQPFAKTRRLGFPLFGFNLLIASMVVALIARDGVLFLFGWEVMAVAAGLLVSFEHERPDALRAGWVYLVVAHVGALCLFVLFLLFKREVGSFDFAAVAAHPPVGATAVTLVVLAFIGFGSKIGFVPLHIWLPEAHAAAPSHVSAVMSGVLLKIGFYGLLRVFLLLGGNAGWWGPLLMGLGLSSAFVAIVVAIYQRDLKRALAYSSIENVGLIGLALGTAWWAAHQGLHRVAALGLAGGLLHVWNHALMKGGMFLVAGSVLHGTGTRDLERMGGLSRRMPLTALGMTVGSLALAALPPLNGFVSEWLMYLGLMHLGIDGHSSSWALMVVGTVALIGGLTALVFVRLHGIALLGQPRSAEAAHAHESSRLMTVPILVLAAVSLGIALMPTYVLQAMTTVRTQLLGAELSTLEPADLASLATVGAINFGLWGVLLLGWLIYDRALSRRPAEADGTWGCGYAAPTSRMEYGARAFAELSSANILPRMLAPVVALLRPLGVLAKPAKLSTDDTDPVTRGAWEPAFARAVAWASWFSWMQKGLLNTYLAYVLAALVIALAWASLQGWGGL